MPSLSTKLFHFERFASHNLLYYIILFQLQLLDPLGVAFYACPRYEQLLNEDVQTEYYQQVIAENQVCREHHSVMFLTVI